MKVDELIFYINIWITWLLNYHCCHVCREKHQLVLGKFWHRYWEVGETDQCYCLHDKRCAIKDYDLPNLHDSQCRRWNFVIGIWQWENFDGRGLAEEDSVWHLRVCCLEYLLNWHLSQTEKGDVRQLVKRKGNFLWNIL